MKLYYSKGACSLAVRILIHELGLNAEYEAVDLKTKKTEKGTDYLTINPKGAVPALAFDGMVLTENAAIQEYLAEKNNAYNLLPSKEDLKRYRVLEWLNFVATDLHKNFGPLFNPELPQEVKEKIFIPLIKKKLDLVDKQLKDHPFISGTDFTLPDGYLFVILSWMHHFKMDREKWPNIARYYKELLHRKSIEQALKEEGLMQ